jgi:hypothetical protein
MGDHKVWVHFIIMKMPYEPVLRRTEAKMQLPRVGDSTCALGNHKWSPKMGNFTLKLIIKIKVVIVLMV